MRTRPGVKLVGGNSKLCAFLKRGCNSSYLWGLHRRRGGCVFKIWMSRGYPRGQKKTSMLETLVKPTYNRTVFPSYSRVSQIKVTNSKVAEDIWFNYLYLKLRFTFACTNYIQSTGITSDHVVSIRQSNTLLDKVLLTLTHSLRF